LQSQLGTFKQLFTDIFLVPFGMLVQLFQAFENVLWLAWIVWAWWVRTRLIILEWLYTDIILWLFLHLWDIIDYWF
jgi:Kef-type K+ transport system membrane component KefB